MKKSGFVFAHDILHIKESHPKMQITIFGKMPRYAKDPFRSLLPLNSKDSEQVSYNWAESDCHFMQVEGKSDHSTCSLRLFSPCDFLELNFRPPPWSPAPPSPDTQRSILNLCDSAYLFLIMPGSSHPQSYELPYQADHREPSVTGSLPPRRSLTTTMTHNVRYTPTQMDSMASLSTKSTRQSPIRLMLQDTGVLLANLRYLPGIVLPFKTSQSSDEFYLDFSGIRDAFVQGVLFMLETIFLVLAIPAFLILPGSLWIVVCAVGGLIVYGLCKPIEGPTVVYSNISEETLATANQHRDERWLFINGCMVG